MADKENVFSFIWKIENFSMLPHKVNERLVSPPFVVDAWKKIDFSLLFYPKGEDEKSNNMSLYLSKMPTNLHLERNFSLTLESTEHSREKTLTVKSRSLESGYGFPKFFSLSELFANKQFYLPQDTLTLRCDINLFEEASEKLSPNSEYVSQYFKKTCVSCTCIEVHRRYIMWSIWNINERMERLEKTSIVLASALKNAPSLKLTLIFNKTSSDDCIRILIRQTCLGEKERLFVKCKITVMSAARQIPTFEESSYLFNLDTSDVWTFPPFITTSMLADETYFYVDDALLLRCEFAFSYKDRIHHLENNYTQFTFKTKKKTSELSTSFESMYVTGKFCDIDLKAGGKTFPYYKLILCARSPVFSAMFENDMKEKNSSVVEIDDVDPDTVQRMLTYMHSDVVEEDLSPEDARKLYGVADKYDVAPLKRRCSAMLLSALSVVNVCEILALADAHQDDPLMTSACDFICCHSNEVYHSSEWKSLMEDNPKLSSSVMHQMLIGKYRF